MNYMQDALTEIEAGLNLVSKEEFSGILQAVAKTAAETVARTLGPYAHTTIIDDGNFSYPTKDGWTVASRLRFADPVHQSIYRMLLQIPFRIVDKVGDGTTTALDVAQHFIEFMSSDREIMIAGKPVRIDSLRQTDVVRMLKDLRDEVVEELRKMAVPIAADETYQPIYRIAYISSNGNTELANIMQQIYEKTKNPNVLVDMAGGEDGISYEIQEGYRLDCNVLMHKRYINTSNKTYETDGKLHQFVIFDHNVTYSEHGKLINDLMKTVNAQSAHQQENIMLVLFAPYFDDLMSTSITAAVDEMLRQHPGAIPSVMLVQIPELTRHQVQCHLHDFAAIANASITNATKVKVYNQMKYNDSIEGKEDADKIQIKEAALKEYQFSSIQALVNSCMTPVRRATFHAKYVTLETIQTDSVRYQEALKQAQQELEAAKAEVKNSTTNMMKTYMEATDRLNRLSGRIGVIHVGGSSELERNCLSDVVDDVFRACRSAYENGIVPGMNLATMVALNKRREYYRHMCDATGEFPYDAMMRGLIEVLYDSYFETVSDLLRNKKGDQETWTYGGSPKTTEDACYPEFNRFDLVYNLVNDVEHGRIGSYDIVTERVYPVEDMRVINSVDTDIEILNGIIGILSLTLTSDQYLSVSRFYDKRVAAKQQELQNQRDAEAKTTAVMGAIWKFLREPANKMLLNIIKGTIEALCQNYEFKFSDNDEDTISLRVDPRADVGTHCSDALRPQEDATPVRTITVENPDGSKRVVSEPNDGLVEILAIGRRENSKYIWITRKQYDDAEWMHLHGQGQDSSFPTGMPRIIHTRRVPESDVESFLNSTNTDSSL